MAWFVVPDAHGRDDLVKGLLAKAGVLDGDGNRVQGMKAVQLGDLANCVAASRDGDVRCLQGAREWFDVVLVGNHEHPYFKGPAFSGFAWFAEVEQELRALDRRGILQPSLLLGDLLLTHAGVTPSWDFADAPAAHEAIQQLWFRDRTAPLFSAIGHARWGAYPFGGILWSDWSEPKDPLIRQLFGHTPLPDGPTLQENGGFALNLDTAGRGSLTGIWVGEDGTVGISPDGSMAVEVTYQAAKP